MAPEIKPVILMWFYMIINPQNVYNNEKIDMWSLGIVLYKMSVAYKPTQVSGYKYGAGPIPFRRVDWRKRSNELQDLIKQLLETDVEKRMSAKDALEHPWFSK